MTKITQIILKLWTWINSIFGYDTKKSTEPEAVGYYRVIIVGFKVAGRLFRCDIVPHRDESGGYHCAILRRVGYPPLTARMIQDVGEYIARDYFHRAADSLSWIYFPLRSEEETSEDVLQFRFVHDETNVLACGRPGWAFAREAEVCSLRPVWWLSTELEDRGIWGSTVR